MVRRTGSGRGRRARSSPLTLGDSVTQSIRMRFSVHTALMVLREKALRGDVRALVRLLELADRFNSDAAQIGPSQPLSADDQAIFTTYVAEYLAAKKISTESPDDRISKPAKRTRKKTRK